MIRTRELSMLYTAFFTSQPMPALTAPMVQPLWATTELPKIEFARETQPTYRRHRKSERRRILRKIKKASQRRNRKNA